MKVYIYKGMIFVYFFMLALLLFLLTLLFDPEVALQVKTLRTFQFTFLVIGFCALLKASKLTCMMIKITECSISSHLFFKKRSIVIYDRPVYISFFSELYIWVDKYTPYDYVMVSNSPIPDFEPNTRFKTFDMSSQIIFPDTEKTRQAIAPLLSSEFCILQGDAPPPIEELRKKKEKKEEPPVVKREKSPDDPPPFTGKWNGRF